MKIRISPDMTIHELQEAFHSHFIWLKIELFTKPHEPGKGSWAKYMIFDKNTTLKDCGKVMEETEIEINPKQTVRSMEQLFQEQFGLNIQVYHRSSGTWIETTRTDTKTLASLNQRAQDEYYFQHPEKFPEEPPGKEIE